MTPEKARIVLGPWLRRTSDVGKAFQMAVRESHPDVAKGGANMAELTDAKRVLLALAQVHTCPHCAGTGYQVIGFRRSACIAGCEPQ